MAPPQPTSLSRRLVRSFLNGLLLLTPVALTVYICWRVLVIVDGWLGLPYPGLGLAATVALVTLFGFIASNVLARTALQLVDRLFDKLPGVRLLYGSVKDLLDAFAGEKRSFDRPVLVALDEARAVRVVGFLTNERLGGLGLGDLVAVYLPQSYNFAGQTLVVPRDRVTPLPVASSEALSFAVSGGVSDLGPATAR